MASGKTIAEAVKALTGTQITLTFTSDDGHTYQVRRAYEYWPSQRDALEYPCWISAWSLVAVDRGPSLRRQEYTIRTQFFAGPANVENAQLAAGMMAEFVTAMDDEITMEDSDGNRTVDHHDLRGGDPTLAILQWNGEDYIGLDLFLDVTMTDAVTHTS